MLAFLMLWHFISYCYMYYFLLLFVTCIGMCITGVNDSCILGAVALQCNGTMLRAETCLCDEGVQSDTCLGKRHIGPGQFCSNFSPFCSAPLLFKSTYSATKLDLFCSKFLNTYTKLMAIILHHNRCFYTIFVCFVPNEAFNTEKTLSAAADEAIAIESS